MSDGTAAADSGEASRDASSAEASADATAGGGGDSGAISDALPSSNVPDAPAETGMGSTPTPPTSALLRFANWSFGAPAIDICIAPHGTKSFQGPLVAALGATLGGDAGAVGAGGLPFPLVSAYMLVPPGSYDARIVVAGATSCVAPLRPDTAILPLAAGAAETVALFGDVTNLAVLKFADELSVTGWAAIRVINAAPSLGQVDVGTGTLSAGNFAAIFKGVYPGQVGPPTGAPIPSFVDGNGYYDSPSIAGLLSAHVSGAKSDAVVGGNPISIATGAVATLVVAGAASRGAVLLICIDNTGTTGLFSACHTP
jgi:hypothetical protein